MVYKPVILVLKGLRVCEFKVSLGYIVRLGFKTKQELSMM
jgi:hypothetical protein